jgi:hypothetical protein
LAIDAIKENEKMTNEAMNTETTDTVDTETVDTADTAQTNVETSNDATDNASAQQTDTSQSALPFQGGKEKFVVNGKEVEWDWETAKRYAQKGYAGMEAFQKAAAVEKKNQELYRQLYDLASKDPEGLVRIFNPQYKSHAQSAQAGMEQNQSVDPLEQRFNQELERKIAPLQEKLEAYEIAEERKAIQSELDAAVKQYPVIGDEIHLEYVKQQYKRALQQGMNVTIDDVAFYVAQKIQEKEAVRMNQTKARIEQKRKEAPVRVTETTQSTGKKPMSFDDVKRMAGLIS